MARILILSLSNIDSDPRVIRQIDSLSKEHEIHVMGFGKTPSNTKNFTEIKLLDCKKSVIIFNALLLFLRCYKIYYWNHFLIKSLQQSFEKINFIDFDLVIANDMMTLPVALKIAKNSPVWLDAHEYAPREFEDKIIWRLLFGPFFDFICRKKIRYVARMTTVCEGIAREYSSKYGINVSVLPNCPSPCDVLPQPVKDNCIKIIHHGVAVSSRRIELMIEMMEHLDSRFTLDLMLVDKGDGYIDFLKKKSEKNKKIRFIEPVPTTEIVRYTNNYDIGLFLLPPTNFNYLHALPNKFFEFMQARLAIAIGPSPEMKSVLEKYQCGVISNSFSPIDLAHCLNALKADQIFSMKKSSDIAAHTYNASHTSSWMLHEVNEVLNKHFCLKA